MRKRRSADCDAPSVGPVPLMRTADSVLLTLRPLTLTVGALPKLPETVSPAMEPDPEVELELESDLEPLQPAVPARTAMMTVNAARGRRMGVPRRTSGGGLATVSEDG